MTSFLGSGRIGSMEWERRSGDLPSRHPSFHFWIDGLHCVARADLVDAAIAVCVEQGITFMEDDPSFYDAVDSAWEWETGDTAPSLDLTAFAELLGGLAELS